jgi:hypothetical protein
MLIAIAVLIIIGVMVSSNDFRDFVLLIITSIFSLVAWLFVMLIRGLIVVAPIAIAVWMIFWVIALFLGK